MDPRTVKKLEREIEEVIAEVIMQKGLTAAPSKPPYDALDVQGCGDGL